ncbi:MAG: hypothetical protein RL007_725 [Bacteroidota bacterium]|jgi:hypothetical protein
MKKHLVYAIAASSLLFSCGGPDRTAELKTVDSLNQVLNATDSIIASLNLDDVKKRADEVANNRKYIQFNVNMLKDTLDFNTALMLTEYREAGKFFDKIKNEAQHVDRSVDSARVSLNNLKHDLENNSLAEGIDLNASLASERVQAAEMKAYAENLQVMVKATVASHDTLAPKVNVYVKQLNEKLSTQKQK